MTFTKIATLRVLFFIQIFQYSLFLSKPQPKTQLIDRVQPLSTLSQQCCCKHSFTFQNSLDTHISTDPISAGEFPFRYIVCLTKQKARDSYLRIDRSLIYLFTKFFLHARTKQPTNRVHRSNESIPALYLYSQQNCEIGIRVLVCEKSRIER